MCSPNALPYSSFQDTRETTMTGSVSGADEHPSQAETVQEGTSH